MTTKFISDMGPKSALIAPRPFEMTALPGHVPSKEQYHPLYNSRNYRSLLTVYGYTDVFFSKGHYEG